MECVQVIKNVSVKVVSFFNGRYIRDQERVFQTLQLPQWRVYWWSRTCLSNSSASSMEGVLVIKNVSVKSFSFSNGWCIGDQERVCKTLQFLQWSVYRWSRTCLSNSSASLMEGIFVIKDVSVKLFSSLNGECIGDQERVCQTLQLLPWRVYWCSRTCLWKSSASLMDGIFVIKYVSAKLFSFFNGGSIGDQVRVCQTLQLPQWRVYWWSRTCLSNSSVSSVEGVFVIKNVSVNFFNGGYIRDQDLQLQLLQWRVYSWSRTCLVFSIPQWRVYWWSRRCSASCQTVSVSFFNGSRYIRDNQERVCQTLEQLKRFSSSMENVSVYSWSRTCLSNSSASSRVCSSIGSVYRWPRSCL